MKKMKFTSRLNVFYNSSSKVIQIGSLIEENNQIYFKYTDEFLQENLNLSPFKLKFTNEIQSANKQPFQGLFGLIADALPDAWGQLLLSRFLLNQQLDSNQLSPLQRLSFVGKNGGGALEFEPATEAFSFENDEIHLLSDYANAAIEILNGNENSLSSSFYQLGGTSGGARPKMDVLYNPLKKEFQNPSDLFSPGFEPWIVKFPSTFDLPDIAHIEYAYYLMAQSAGIKMSQSELLPSSINGQYFFGTKRFDRMGLHKIHKHSVAGLLHDDYQKSAIDYGHIMDAAFQLQKNRNCYEPILRLAAFNVFACNQDDHSKNFSFLMDADGNWSFAPAYDLTFSPNVYNFHSISVAQKHQNILGGNLLELANYFSIKNGKEIIEEVYDTVQEWGEFAKLGGVNSNSTKKIKQKIHSIPLK